MTYLHSLNIWDIFSGSVWWVAPALCWGQPLAALQWELRGEDSCLSYANYYSITHSAVICLVASPHLTSAPRSVDEDMPRFTLERKMVSRECDVHSSTEKLLCQVCHSLKCCFFSWGRLCFDKQDFFSLWDLYIPTFKMLMHEFLSSIF